MYRYLIYSPDSSRLVSPSVPNHLIPDSWTLLTTFHAPDMRRFLIVAQPSTHAIAYIDPNGALVPLTTTPADARPLCASLFDTNVITVHTARGPFYIRYISDGGNAPFAVCGFAPGQPLVTMRAANPLMLSVEVPARSLHGTYSASSRRLNDADFSAISADLLDAYLRLADDAAAAGRYIQPVVATCTLFDKLSLPVGTPVVTLLTPTDGVQCAEWVSMTIADGSLASYTLSAWSFIPEVTVDWPDPDFPGAPVRHTIDIVNALQPFVATRRPRYALSYSGSGSLSLRMSLPGASSVNSCANRAALPRLITSLIPS